MSRFHKAAAFRFAVRSKTKHESGPEDTVKKIHFPLPVVAFNIVYLWQDYLPLSHKDSSFQCTVDGC
jgi:hypothetical protein